MSTKLSLSNYLFLWLQLVITESVCFELYFTKFDQFLDSIVNLIVSGAEP